MKKYTSEMEKDREKMKDSEEEEKQSLFIVN